MDRLVYSGLILFGIGLLALSVYGMYHGMYQLIFVSDEPSIIKLGIGGMVIGMVVILFSVIRERIKEVSSDDVGGKY